MPGLNSTGALRKLFNGPSAIAVAPSSSGLNAFRELQQEALRNFKDESKLADFARRLRNQIVAGFVVGVVAASVVAVVAAAPASAIATSRSESIMPGDPTSVRQAVLELEKTATDYYAMRVGGALPEYKESARHSVLAAASGLHYEMSKAAGSGNEAAFDEARSRVLTMAGTPLGQMGIDLVHEAVPTEDNVRAEQVLYRVNHPVSASKGKMKFPGG